MRALGLGRRISAHFISGLLMASLAIGCALKGPSPTDLQGDDDDDNAVGGTDGGGANATGGDGSGATGAGGSGTGAGHEGGSGGGGSNDGPHGTCGSGGPTGEHNQVTLPSGQYYIWAPPPDPNQPIPLVMAFHGDEGHPDQAVTWFWGPVFDNHQDFIVVAPVCPGSNGSWYQGDHASYAAHVTAILADVAGGHNVDIDRIYAIGYSGGSCFLSMYAFDFQDVFAGVQWSCGGATPSYAPPPKPACKVDGHFHISADDFLLDAAEATHDVMVANGHHVDWTTPPCSGHCCANTSGYAEDALQWFLGRTKCDATGSGCGEVTDLP